MGLSGLSGLSALSSIFSAPSTLLNGLGAYWPLDEVGFLTRRDVLGSYDLTDNAGTVDQTRGKIGNSAAFTGVNTKYLKRADASIFNFGASDWTLAGWFYSTTTNTIQSIVTQMGNTPNYGWAWHTYNDGRCLLQYSLNGTTALNLFTTATITANTWTFFVIGRNGTNLSVALNNGTAQTASVSTSSLFNTTADFMIGQRGLDNALSFTGRVCQVGLWPSRWLSAAEQTALYNSGTGNPYPFGATWAPLIVCDGDSMTAGTSQGLTPSQYYPGQLQLLYGAGAAYVINDGVGSQKLTDMESSAATTVDALFVANYRKKILVIFGGTNDIQNEGISGATCYGRLQTYTTNRRAAGWKIVGVTMLARGASSSFNTARQAFNTALRSGVGTDVDAVADLATDTRLDDGTATLPTGVDSGDGVHPSATGYGYIAAKVKAAADTLL